jgi:hypothetical protein
MNIDPFTQQHAEIQRCMQKLRRLSYGGIAINADQIAALIIAMRAVIKLYLAVDDRALYPSMAKKFSQMRRSSTPRCAGLHVQSKNSQPNGTQRKSCAAMKKVLNSIQASCCVACAHGLDAIAWTIFSKQNHRRSTSHRRHTTSDLQRHRPHDLDRLPVHLPLIVNQLP